MTNLNDSFSTWREEIEQVLNYLSDGKTILCITDTIWGISCDPFNENTYQALYGIKNRKPEHPFVLLVSDLEMLKRYVASLPPRIENLLVYHNRPITLIYPKTQNLPEHCLAQDGSIAIRITREPFSQQLIRSFNRPIASTSANISGDPYPKHFGEISSEICGRVDYIVQYGRSLTIGKPSQIFSFDEAGQLHNIRD